MKYITLSNIARVCSGELHIPKGAEGDIAEREASGVFLDSRKVVKDSVFIAAPGEKVDGHSFIPQAAAQQALGLICERPPIGTGTAGASDDAEIPYVLVKDSFQALKDIAAFYRQQLSLKVVGITGSVGKTSTKEFIAAVLNERFPTWKTQGNYNNEIGLPLTVLEIPEGTKAAVLEMGISDFGEMSRLSAIARPDICVLTNIGQCHLENLGSREGILKAKTEIFEYLPEDGFVCINGDDDMLISIGEVRGRKPFRFGMHTTDGVHGEILENMGLFGSRIRIHLDGSSFMVRVPLPGQHMVCNALAAACVGSLLGLEQEEMIRGIEAVQPVAGRSNIMQLPGVVLIDDCYNANPASMKAAIDLLDMALSRKAAVLGDMFQLGSEEEKLHEEIGAYAVRKGIDVLVCIGDLSRHIYEGAAAVRRDGMKNAIYHFPDKEAFLEKANDILEKGDTVLIKASHGMDFVKLVETFQTNPLFL